MRPEGLTIGHLFERVGDATQLTYLGVCMVPLFGSVLQSGRTRSREGALRSCKDLDPR